MRNVAIAAFTAAAICVSVAFGAGYLIVDDSGIDYTNTDLSKAYLGFDPMGENVVVILSASRFEGSIGTVDFDVPDLDREDFFGTPINADLTSIADVRWSGVNNRGADAAFLVEMEATHLDTSLEDVLTGYHEALERLGFSRSVTDTAARSVKVATFSNGSTTLIVRLHGRAGDVAVRLNAL